MTIEIGVAFVILGAITGAFWRMWALIDKAGEEGRIAQRELAKFQTHVAENFATKDGMQRQTDQLLRAMESIGTRIDALTTRIDNMIKPRSTRQ